MDKIKTGKPTSIRELNRKIILNMMKERKYVSKVELTKESGLKMPTVSNIINELITDNVVVYHGKGKSNKNGGPKPDLYKLNYIGKCFIGVDIGLNGVQGIILDMEANIMYKVRKKPCYDSQDKLLRSLKSIISKLIEKSEIAMSSVEGIGIAITGLVNGNTGEIKTSGINMLNSFKLKEIIEKEYSIKTYLDNDINFLTTGQKLYDIQKKQIRNALFLGIINGVGLGILIEGKLYRGSEGMSGNVSCFKNAKGDDAIKNDVKEFIERNRDFDLKRMNISKIEDIEISHICYAIQKNDRDIIEIVKKSFFDLGILTGMLIQVFNPDCIILCSRIFKYSEELFDYTVGISRDFCKNLPFFSDEISFVRLPLEEETIAYNAASHVLKEYYSISKVFGEV